MCISVQLRQKWKVSALHSLQHTLSCWYISVTCCVVCVCVSLQVLPLSQVFLIPRQAWIIGWGKLQHCLSLSACVQCVAVSVWDLCVRGCAPFITCFLSLLWIGWWAFSYKELINNIFWLYNSVYFLAYLTMLVLLSFPGLYDQGK